MLGDYQTTWRSLADGTAISMAEAEVAWSKYLMDDARANYETANDNSSVKIHEVGQVTAGELSVIIRGNGGQFVTIPSDPLVNSARGQWWKFSVEVSTDGKQARITENNYVLYGGIGVAGLVLWMLLS